MRHAIAVMARSPYAHPETIKTRLTGPVPRQADRCALYEAFLQDTLAKCRRLTDTGLRVAFTPHGAGEDFAALDVPPDERLPQRGDDLGERERNVFVDLFDAGFDAVLLTGSDLPTLPQAHLQQARTLLADGARLVIGSAADGGYYLLGLPKPEGDVPDLFSAIRWSTRWTLPDTLNAAQRIGLEPSFIPEWHDVDDGEGWERLRADLQDSGLAAEAARTRAVVERLVGDGS